jgi:hypothetical protein
MIIESLLTMITFAFVMTLVLAIVGYYAGKVIQWVRSKRGNDDD